MTSIHPFRPARRKSFQVRNRLAQTLLALLAALPAGPAFAEGVVHIPEPVGGFTGDPSEGITFGDTISITPSVYASTLSFNMAVAEFWGEIQITDGVSGVGLYRVVEDMDLYVAPGINTGWLTLKNPIQQYSQMSFGKNAGEIKFGSGTAALDTTLARSAAGVLQINGQTVVTQNALANYVTLTGTQTLTNKIIDAGQLTGTVSSARLPAETTLLGSSIDLSSETTGTLPVAEGGTGATTLTGILKGNGTGAVTTVTAPSGTLVGTTDTQTLSNKTFSGSVLFQDAVTVNGHLSLPNQTIVDGDSVLTLESADPVYQRLDVASVALGSNASVSGSGNLAIGPSARATSTYSIAIGKDAFATGTAPLNGMGSLAVGVTTNTQAAFGVAIGSFGSVLSEGGTGVGVGAAVNGTRAAALGYSSTAVGEESVAIGAFSRTDGNYSVALGSGLTAQGYRQVVMGQYNVAQGNSTAWVSTDDLFTLGNGTSGSARSNAFVIKKNGNTSIAGDLAVSGNITNPSFTGTVQLPANVTIGGSTVTFPSGAGTLVTAAGTQTLTNKSIDAGQLTGTLPVAKGGTGATTLTGILKGNGTGAVTTVTAPAGALVGTTDTQTLSNKTFSGSVTFQNAVTINGNLSLPNQTVTNSSSALTAGLADQRYASLAASDITLGLNAGNNGGNAVAIGALASAGQASVSIGASANDNGYLQAVTIGAGASTAGDSSVTLGGAAATDSYGTAVGSDSVAGYSGVSIGFNAHSEIGSEYTVALGESAYVDGNQGIAIGSVAVNAGESGIAIGASAGVFAVDGVAIGHDAQVNAIGAVALGRYNSTLRKDGTAPDPNFAQASDPILSIGNGTSDIARANSFTLYRDGTARFTGALQLPSNSPTISLYDPANPQTTVGQITLPSGSNLGTIVTSGATQTLTNKSIDAGQLTGSVAATKGGTGLTSYTTGDLLYAGSSSSLSKLPATATGNALISGGTGTAPSWGKIGLTTHVSGTLPVANGGTGATTLTGILKGNGTGAVTTITSPDGALVGTTDTQTLSNKTLASPTLSGSITGDANGLVLNAGGANKNITLNPSGTGRVVTEGDLTAGTIDTPVIFTPNIAFNAVGDGTDYWNSIEYFPGDLLSISTQDTLFLYGGLGVNIFSPLLVSNNVKLGVDPGFEAKIETDVTDNIPSGTNLIFTPYGNGKVIVNGAAAASGSIQAPYFYALAEDPASPSGLMFTPHWNAGIEFTPAGGTSAEGVGDLCIFSSNVQLMTDHIGLGTHFISQISLTTPSSGVLGEDENIEIKPGGELGRIVLDGPITVTGDAAFNGTVSYAVAPSVGSSPVVTQNQLSSYQTTTGSGSGLTNLNASALATGTVPAERLPAISFASLQGKPTTVAGYGITDALAVTRQEGTNYISSAIRILPQGDLDMGDFH